MNEGERVMNERLSSLEKHLFDETMLRFLFLFYLFLHILFRSRRFEKSARESEAVFLLLCNRDFSNSWLLLLLFIVGCLLYLSSIFF
jgi:hypothetical protein